MVTNHTLEQLVREFAQTHFTFMVQLVLQGIALQLAHRNPEELNGILLDMSTAIVNYLEFEKNN